MNNPAERPVPILKAEHRIIERVLRVLENLMLRFRYGEGFEVEALRRCVVFFGLFADACHHAKEENLLFPVLESRGIPREGGPIGVMLAEHAQARELTRRMSDCLDAVEAGRLQEREAFYQTAAHYLSLLSNHIMKEDNILFSLGDRAMTDEDQQTLCTRFCEVGCRAFEGRTREDLERIADELEQRWG